MTYWFEYVEIVIMMALIQMDEIQYWNAAPF